MSEADEFSKSLLEEAKHFFEKAESESSLSGKAAYLHASLNLAFCALEAHVNGIADDFSGRDELNILEKSLLSEKEVRLVKGQFVLTDSLRMSRLEDRIEFLHQKFSGTEVDKAAVWWPKLQRGLSARNTLSHPKGAPTIDRDTVKLALEAVIDAIDALFFAVYKRRYPGRGRGLDSTLTF